MSDDQYLDSDDGEQDESPVIKELRKKLKDAEGKASRVTGLEREVLLHDAGLGKLKPSQKKALLATHDGDWDSDSVLATAQDLGFHKAISSESTTEEESTSSMSQDEFNAMQNVNDLSSSGPPPPPKGINDQIKATNSTEELMALLAEHEGEEGWPALTQY